MIADFIAYLFRCQSLHLVHSPFVYAFCTKVLPSQKSEIVEKVEDLRKKMLADESLIEWKELGAGFKGNQKGNIQKKVKEIAQGSARKKHEGALLYRICQYYQPKRVLEFGTNLGISTLYQFSAIPDNQFITMEGVAPFAQIAQQNFATFSLSPKIIVGEFSQSLQAQNNFLEYQPDYVFWMETIVTKRLLNIFIRFSLL